MDKKVILITGASSGFGFELAKDLALKNHIVYGVARRKEKLKPLMDYGVSIGVCDVEKEDDVHNIINRIIMECGRIDVVYCNAGYGHYNTIEDTTVEEVRRQLDVNVLGVHRVVREVLPYMRERNEGRIVITTSVVANVSIPFGGWYAASKHALDGMANALRMETEDLGIEVVTVEPGRVTTEFGEVSYQYLKDEFVSDDYLDFKYRYDRLLRRLDKKEVSSKSTIKAMVHAGLSERPKVNYKTTYDSVALSTMRKVMGRKLYYKVVSGVLWGRF